MKKLILFIALAFGLHFNGFSQDYAYANPYQAKSAGSSVYLGFGTGINYYLGLFGPSLEYRLAQDFTLFAGAGLGTWGYKYSIGSRYYTSFPNSWAFGLGFSATTGLNQIEFDMPEGTIVGVNSIRRVPFKLNNAKTVNLSALKFWNLGSSGRNRFNIELGYAFKAGTNPYTILDNSQLTTTGVAFMDVLRPGGLTLGVGFSFGLN